MDESNIDYSDTNSITKTHKEILEMLEEIKELEKKFGEFYIEEPLVEEDLIEVEYETFEEIEPELISFKEVEEKKPKFEEKIKKPKSKLKIKRKKDFAEKIEKPITPTTFRLRINKEGELENIDLKKPKPRSRRHIRIRFRKKGQTESEVTEEISRLAKLKSGLGKIKRAIPTRREEEEETEESETSEAM